MFAYHRGRAACYYIVFYVIFGIVRFTLLLLNGIDYGNQYNESDPTTANFEGWFLKFVF